MYESQWIELLKKEMIEAVNVLNFENVDVQKELLEKQFSVFQSLQDLHSFKREHEINQEQTDLSTVQETPSVSQKECKPVAVETVSEKTEETIEIPNEKTVTLTTKPTYRFERKIKGGFVPEIEGFVPEGIVRKLDLHHGDMVYATPMETEDNSRHFRYEIVEKGDGKDAPDRVQFNYCAVKKEAGRFVVDRSEESGNYIRHDDCVYTVILDDSDVLDLRIKEGSLIDIAFPVGKPNLAKVLYTHKVEETGIPFSSQNKKNVSNKVEKTEKKDKPSTDKTLEGKTVLVIGNQPKKSLYKMVVEQRGGVFLWADAKEKLTRLQPLVRKSDLVVFLLSVSGHVGMEHIKQMCKEHGVAFETTWSKGQTTLIKLAEEKIVSTA
jgi:hypothetical protein